ncbi:MAG: argininosuccinate lyase [Verrucomicrobia bacterium]|nr:argininosuccinate lyase [Verrucomicrobiota bacterium]MCH8513021.1 argininosuccinate lyase [Kiritimatiellia bacterium]
MSTSTPQTTTVGNIDDEILAFTAGKDLVLDLQLAEADCIGSAAHVTMLSRMPVQPPVLTPDEATAVRAELAKVLDRVRAGDFEILAADQDVHLAVERTLTESLGDLGKKIHTGRSRNDQVAVDLRLFGKQRLLDLMEDTAHLAAALTNFGEQHVKLPMVGRTHMQPAMPSSVGLWATSHAEAALEDLESLRHVFTLNDQCPLGAAAGYGVPLPIDRQLTSDLLGFSRPIHNVSHAINARGKLEYQILQAMGQLMITVSRIAQDLMLYTLPEFGYFRIPKAFGTGSSIMPNKNNPDVLELLRSKAALVLGHGQAVGMILHAAPGGYNRDLQDTKEPFLEGLAITRASVRILARCVEGLDVNPERLRGAFDGGVFATDAALAKVAEGMPFRDAYHYVKAHLDELDQADPDEAIALKTHLGGTAGLDFALYRARIGQTMDQVRGAREHFEKVTAELFRF